MDKEEIQVILDDNLKNKQLLDLVIHSLDTTECLKSENKLMAIFQLLDSGGLDIAIDNLMNVSNSVNDVNARLSDLLEDK